LVEVTAKNALTPAFGFLQPPHSWCFLSRSAIGGGFDQGKASGGGHIPRQGFHCAGRNSVQAQGKDGVSSRIGALPKLRAMPFSKL
jgi:hypothetical protein